MILIKYVITYQEKEKKHYNYYNVWQDKQKRKINQKQNKE